jgi:hypothetical protein
MMRNYFVVVLCFVTLTTVALDVVLLHPRTVKAAAAGVVRLQSVQPGPPSEVIHGDVVGFSCSPSGCFVATYEKR